MGKNQSASNLPNIIKQDANGSIAFMHGNTMLMQVSSSGAITTTGVISGSNALSASYAQTASFANTLTVAGNLTAQTLVVQTITSSVDFVTGSTRFGSLANNTHTFTGSVSINGSLSGSGALFTNNLRTDTGLGLKYGSFTSTSGYLNLFSALISSTATLSLKDGTGGFEAALNFPVSANRNYTFPNEDGTVALTSNLSSYLPLSGGTLTGPLSGTSAAFSGSITSVSSSGFIGAYSTNAANDATIGAYWSNSSGLEIKYNPNTAVGYIQSLYNVVSGQPFGDIHFRQNVGGTMTTRMIIKNDGGNVGIGTTTPIDRLTVSGRLNLLGLNQNSIWFNQNAGGSSTGYLVGRSYSSDDANDFFIYNVATATRNLAISSAGATTFSNSVTAASLSTPGNLNYTSGNGVDWYINPPANGPTIRLRYHGGSTDRSGGLGWINNAGGRTEALTWADQSVSFGGVVTTPYQPAFRAYYSVNSTWALASNATFVFDATEYNIGTCYNATNGRFTAPVAGVYQFNFYTIVLGNYQNAAISFRKNGGVLTSGFNMHFSPYYTSTSWSNVVYTTSLYLNNGDYVSMINGSGETINYHGDDWSSFSGYLVG